MWARWAITTAALALLAGLGAAAPAAAKTEWRDCRGLRGVPCTTVHVPLDRSGAIGGRVGLNVARVAAGRRKPYMMYLSGGPGLSLIHI